MKGKNKVIFISLIIVCVVQMNMLTLYAEESWSAGPDINTESAIVMEADTGTVLYEKNVHERLYPASITKIMTCLLAVENCDLAEQVTFSYDSVHKTEGSSIWRDVDEVMTMEQCLYGMMLNSANECAYAVAEHTGGTYENFIQMMNNRINELGGQDTNFNNPHGLTDENHYTSCYDMALISKQALKSDIFRKIVDTKKYTIPLTNKHPNEETYLVNHHKMLLDNTEYSYEYCIGGKTGYTEAAGNTLVTFAEKDGMTLICIVMNEKTPNHYIDTKNLLNYCFENFKLWNISQNKVNLKNNDSGIKFFETQSDFVKIDEAASIILPKLAKFTDAVPTVTENTDYPEIVGTIQYTYKGKVVGVANIELTREKIEPFPFKQNEGVESKEVVILSNKNIVWGILAFILLCGLGTGIYFFIKNFYLIRYKLITYRNRNLNSLNFKTKKNRKKRKRW